MSHLIKLILIAALLTACAPALSSVPPINDQGPATSPDDAVSSSDPSMSPSKGSPYAPKPGDVSLTRGAVFIDSAQLLIMESYPPQVALILKGSQPTPCNELRVFVNKPDAENRIQVEAYSVSEPGKICIEVLAPFDVNIPLGSYPPGHYTVLVNGKQVGDFDS